MLYDKRWEPKVLPETTKPKVKKKPPAPELDDVGKLILKTAKYFENNKWGKNAYANEYTGSVCLVGGIRKVATGVPYSSVPLTGVLFNPKISLAERAVERVGSYIVDKWNAGYAESKCTSWNDSRNTSKAKVIELLRKALYPK